MPGDHLRPPGWCLCCSWPALAIQGPEPITGIPVRDSRQQELLHWCRQGLLIKGGKAVHWFLVPFQFDYLLRDGAGVKMSVKFDYRWNLKCSLVLCNWVSRRFFEYIDLTDCGGRLRISMRDKIARNVQQLFEDRASLHMWVCVRHITICHSGENI